MQFAGSSGDNRVIRRSLIDGAYLKSRQTKSDTHEISLQLYTEPPTDDISLIEFEEVAVWRLRVLKKVEELKYRYAKLPEELHGAYLRELSKLMPIACGLCTPENLTAERKRDRISHHILRLAFCKTLEQTKWFINHEVELFRFRFQMESKNIVIINRFLEMNKFPTEVLSAHEIFEMENALSNTVACLPQKVATMNFWKMPFTDALDLVRRRKTYLENGMAYVSQQDLVTIVCARLRLNISLAMARASKYIGFIEEENRLMPLLNKLTNKIYLGREYIGRDDDSTKITPSMLNKLSLTSFPLCMRDIHARLRNDHHLRHGARMQYGLFLKGIGLSLDDAVLFWREEFCKTMDSEKFERQYAYNIRHNYGKEGRRVNYSAFPCSKIILGAAPATNDCHGCPFRHNDSTTLAKKLETAGLPKDSINSIIAQAKQAQYDRACTRYFEIMHQIDEGNLGCLITHPNQYFELSQKRKGVAHISNEKDSRVEIPININSSDREKATSGASI